MAVKLSDEQQKFVDWAKMGANVLVDACIGSGKTTAIQELVSELGKTKRILYLTYNKLLKLDAKDRITTGGTYVTNYHGFAFAELMRYGIQVGYSDIMTEYNKRDLRPREYDLLVIDEYQDIDYDISQMLLHIQKYNPRMQIVAVGDMDQKIYDYTKLEADSFILDFLGDNYRPMEFTKCFRLNAEWANLLGDVWEKTIVGVNDSCEVLTITNDEAFEIASKYEPSQLLVLGGKSGAMTDLQNRLEEECPDIFNKYTVWSKINDKEGGATQPDPTCAVFTTYDGCKGMERDVCIIYNWTEEYWNQRLWFDSDRYRILRNIFLVAASRGKKKILIVKDKDHHFLTFDTIKKSEKLRKVPQVTFNISDMFDYKYIEDIEECYGMLELEKVQEPDELINTPMADGLIDLSPCIGNFQEASFFQNYNIDEAILHARRINKGELIQRYNTSGWSVFGKVLYLTALETNLVRYISQVRWDFVPDWAQKEIHRRLATVFTPYEIVQKGCSINTVAVGYGEVKLQGICDVLKDNVVWELKFVSALAHTHFLQCACYMLAMDLQEGMLFNVRDGEIWRIHIPNRIAFLIKVLETVTKGKSQGVDELPEKEKVVQFIARHSDACRPLQDAGNKGQLTAEDIKDFMDENGFVLDVPPQRLLRYFVRNRRNATSAASAGASSSKKFDMSKIVSGTKVKHKKYGTGEVLNKTSDKIEVEFDTGARKSFLVPMVFTNKFMKVIDD